VAVHRIEPDTTLVLTEAEDFVADGNPEIPKVEEERRVGEIDRLEPLVVEVGGAALE
jgi:hypothetical protein